MNFLILNINNTEIKKKKKKKYIYKVIGQSLYYIKYYHIKYKYKK